MSPNNHLSPFQKAMADLAYEVQRLPVSEERTALEIEHAWLGRDLHPETYRDLRAKVTQARFAVAQADLLGLRADLDQVDGRPFYAERLAKWLRGPAGWPAIADYFHEASLLANGLDQKIFEAREARRLAREARRCSRGNGRR